VQPLGARVEDFFLGPASRSRLVLARDEQARLMRKKPQEPAGRTVLILFKNETKEDIFFRRRLFAIRGAF